VTGREAIRGVQHNWASPRALLEPCARCGRVGQLMPVYRRKGGARLCLTCGHAQRRGKFADDPDPVALRLCDCEPGGGR
jgi:hypothetical protein